MQDFQYSHVFFAARHADVQKCSCCGMNWFQDLLCAGKNLTRLGDMCREVY